MSAAQSKHLNPGMIRGVEKLGDAMLPGGDGFPSFSSSGCARHLDRILDYMPEQDIGDLKMLLSLLSALPFFLVRFFAWFLEFGASSALVPSSIAAQLRTIRLGVRGLIFSLYYGDPVIHREIGYEVGVYTDDVL